MRVSVLKIQGNQTVMGVDKRTYRSISFGMARRLLGDWLAYLKRREHADNTKNLECGAHRHLKILDAYQEHGEPAGRNF